MSRIRSILAIVILFACYSAAAQELTLPAGPPSHKFFDRQNTTAFVALGGLVTADAVTTQRLINSGVAHEANPMWSPMVQQGWPGEMAASALGYSATLGVAYTFHKMGHHKMERWANWMSVVIEAGNVAHNGMVAAAH
jgi:hypothetical protein